jgi:hypothetical protein
MFKEIVSRDWGGLLIVLLDRYIDRYYRMGFIFFNSLTYVNAYKCSGGRYHIYLTRHWVGMMYGGATALVGGLEHVRRPFCTSGT